MLCDGEHQRRIGKRCRARYRASSMCELRRVDWMHITLLNQHPARDTAPRERAEIVSSHARRAEVRRKVASGE